MSAIGAIFSDSGVHPQQLDVLRDALGAMPHDSIGTWRSGPFGLAAATYHTTGESRAQAQPLASDDDKVAVVFDGYLLNPEELARDLDARGVRLRTRADVEIVLRAYEAWGESFAARLEGEYALIIADARMGRLLVTRDHLGFVPIFHRRDGNALHVASDFRSLAAIARTPMEPDHLYLAQIAANQWWLREATPWRGVHPVLRAHVLSFDGKRVEQRSYWEPPTKVTIRHPSLADYAEHYRDVLSDCLRRASRSHLPVGVAVSGGLDSSSLFCLADGLERAGQWGAPGLVGYSLAAPEGSNAFELPFARAAAAHVGRPLTEVALFDPDIDWYEADARWHHGLPIISNGAMMLGLDSRVVEDGGRVLINGSGGDEWLQGNAQYYREFTAERDFAGFRQSLARDAAALGWRRALALAARQASAELTPSSVRRMVSRQLRAQRRRSARQPLWLRPEWRAALVEAEEEYTAQLPENGVQWAKHNLLKSPFSDLTYTLMRRQRARIGLESRHPMLSRRFIEFSLQTPAYIKRMGGVSKAIHREAMQGILPEVILTRTTKANFTNAKIDAQLADYVRRHADELLAPICDFDGLERLLRVDFSSPEGDYWAWEIWGLYASAAFLYQYKRVTEINPATGVQQDRNAK